MDPLLQEAVLQLGQVAARNGASVVMDRVRKAKGRSESKQTIEELQEIINDLIADKNDLIAVGKSLEEQLTAHTINEEDIQFISEQFVPVVESVLEKASGGALPEEVQDLIDSLKPLLSPQVLIVAQLLGFSFRQALGEPLTKVARAKVLSLMPDGHVDEDE